MDNKLLKQFDIPTIIAISLIAYILSVVGHEIIGHGGTCAVLGVKITTIGAYYIDCPTPSGTWQARTIAAMGISSNIITMLFSSLMLSRIFKSGNNAKSINLALFYWLLFAINGFSWAGYFGFSGISNIGDYGTGAGGGFEGIANAWIFRIALIIIGVTSYLLIAKNAAQKLCYIFGANNVKTARKFSLIAYFSGGALAIAVGLLNPVGIFITLASAAASTIGGTSGLCWLQSFMKSPDCDLPDISRNYKWIAVSVILSLAFAAILGPSLNF